MVGPGTNSAQFIMFNEPRYVFKKFSMLRYIAPEQKLLIDKPESQVLYVVENVTMPQIFQWLDNSFVLNEFQQRLQQIASNHTTLQMKFMDVRTSKPLLMTFMIQDNSAQITISSDSMELCGDLAQDMFVTNLKQIEVETQDCRFPGEMARLGELLAQIEQHN